METKEFKVAEKDAVKVNSPASVFTELLTEHYNPIQEEMYLLIFNSQNKLIEKVMVARGGLASVSVEPSVLFRYILITNGNNFILAHNHPSGCIGASDEDIKYTQHIQKAAKMMGLSFLDHIIFTETEFNSLREKGLF